MTTSPLSGPGRRAALAGMGADDGLDVLVIGGGVTGAGVALDAATRGLRTGIVEAQDWAAGTSSRSSKLVHGGLRYLQRLDLALVAEALRERDVLLHTVAPHLVSPMPFAYPLRRRGWERPYVAAGVGLYDTLAALGARRRSMPAHRHLGRHGAALALPALRPDAMVGAIRYWDARVDDARLVLELVRTATSHGALAASRARVVSLTRGDGGRVTGAVVADVETGAEHRVRARHVIGATGVWTERLEALAGVMPATTPGALRVVASKGVHLVVRRERLPGDVGIIVPTESSVLFLIPWEDHWIIGTTDTAWHGPLEDPVATAADVDAVLAHANAVLAEPLTRGDVVGTFAGLRPLLRPGRPARRDERSVSAVSREHTVSQPVPGLTLVAGGKLTTYRIMAADAVDLALGRQSARTHPSRTARTPLVGARGLAAVRAGRAAVAARYGWSLPRVDGLLGRYGSALTTLLAMVDADPALGRPLAGAPAHLRVEIAFGVAHEGALHLEDLLARRTRLAYSEPAGGLAAAAEAAAVAGDLLGWDPAEQAAEVDAYARRVHLEAAARRPPGDDGTEGTGDSGRTRRTGTTDGTAQEARHG